jgi:tetratricopeptide (TPR) repeat protein/predicted Ser/Thr protein kinase
MECPVCATPNSASATECGKCHTPLATPVAQETLNEGGAPADWSVAGSSRISAAAAESDTVDVGTVLGARYEILKLLGQGGMGAVYKARDTELDRIVALKLIRPELAKNPEILRRFKQELILARQVTHKNVIRIFDLGQSDGIKFITMDFVDGRDLKSLLLEKNKLAPEQAARIMLQICRALEAAHTEGVIHRDLKPQNIMLDASGRVYVMDFGIARSAYLPGMTQTGMLIGTPEYMSPEQGRGEKLTERSDIFSLGIIFYELLIGTSPYHSDTPLATLWKRMQEKATPPIVADPTLPQALSDIVVKALEIEPEKRLASAGEMAQQLEIWLGPTVGSSTVFLPAPRTNAYWKWAASALALLLVVGTIVFRLKGPLKPKAVHAPVSVLVADFTNHTGDPIFDNTLEPMFNVALEGASFINAYNRGTARKLAEKLPNPTDKLDEQSARLVALSKGISTVIAGEISRRGNNYNVTAIALDAASGNVLAKAEATSTDKDGVVGTVPKLVAPIRNALGDTTPESAQLEHARGAFTAASIEVVHQYGVAMEQQFKGKTEEALRSFAKAAELDPNFARAYSGMTSSAIKLDRQTDAEKYIKLAMEHVDRMTDRERYRVRGLYYGASGNWQKCAEEYTQLVAQYPGDNIGHNNLAYCLTELRELPKAVEEARRDVETNPNATAASNLSLFMSYAGDFQSGEAQARDVQKKYPSSESGYIALALAQLAQGQLPQASETYSNLEKLNAHGASMAAWGLSDLALYQGRFADAVRMLEKGASSDLAAKNNDAAAEKFAKLAYTQLWMQRKGSAIAAAEKALANSQTIKIRFLAAQVFTETGEQAKAQKLATGLASEVQAEAQADAKIIEGDLALKRKDTRQAVKAMTEANGLLDTWIGRFELGRAYLEANAFAEADSEFDQCLKRRGEALSLFLDEVPTYGYFPPVYYYQGRVREGLKSSGAADSYRNYLSIRGQAREDPLLREIQHRLGQ